LIAFLENCDTALNGPRRYAKLFGGFFSGFTKVNFSAIWR
jgi:hypothetical protein